MSDLDKSDVINVQNELTLQIGSYLPNLTLHLNSSIILEFSAPSPALASTEKASPETPRPF